MGRSKLYLLPLLLLFVFDILEISQSQLPHLCHPYDQKVLLRIKNTLGNPSSIASWDPKTDCCFDWYNTQCNDCVKWGNIQCNEQGHVTSLSFVEVTDIHGPIPPFLETLPWLTRLSFGHVPNLSGPIPSYIGKLTNLTVFIISDTKVSGPIPNFLARFTNLVQFELSSSQFTGPIPDFLGKLKSLSSLDLSSNRLTGPIPITLAQLVNLSYLRLSSNKLSGRLPAYLGKFSNLNTIELDSNSFTGPIPASFGHMPNLTTLSLSDNQLTGTIPKSLGSGWSVLMTLRLSHNRLTGDASFLFDKGNTADVDIYVEFNLLKFDLSNVDFARNLGGFNLSHNMIYGSLPLSFGLVKVGLVDVSYNQLCGPIPNGRRFKRVDPAIFSHNKCLCGGPLRACK